MKKWSKIIFICIMLLLIYMPILILAVYSFTTSANIGSIHGWSLFCCSLVFLYGKWMGNVVHYIDRLFNHGERKSVRQICSRKIPLQL